jgi:hypothetical protein
MNSDEIADALFDLRDVRNVLSKNILNKPKDNDGSIFTVGDCLDHAIEILERLESEAD